MTHINKPLALRNALGMHKAAAGHIILRIADKKQAYKQWARIELENEIEHHLSNGLDREFDRYFWLIDNGHIELLRQMMVDD